MNLKISQKSGVCKLDKEALQLIFELFPISGNELNKISGIGLKSSEEFLLNPTPTNLLSDIIVKAYLKWLKDCPNYPMTEITEEQIQKLVTTLDRHKVSKRNVEEKLELHGNTIYYIFEKKRPFAKEMYRKIFVAFCEILITDKPIKKQLSCKGCHYTLNIHGETICNYACTTETLRGCSIAECQERGENSRYKPENKKKSKSIVISHKKYGKDPRDAKNS